VYIYARDDIIINRDDFILYLLFKQYFYLRNSTSNNDISGSLDRRTQSQFLLRAEDYYPSNVSILNAFSIVPLKLIRNQLYVVV